MHILNTVLPKCTNITFPIEGIAEVKGKVLNVQEVGEEEKWTILPFLKEMAFSSWLNKGTLQKCALDQILAWKESMKMD